MVFKTPKYTKAKQMNPKQPERGSTGMNSTFFNPDTLPFYCSYFGIIIQITCPVFIKLCKIVQENGWFGGEKK